MEAQIRVLDPSASPGGQGSSQGPLGCAGGSESSGGMGTGAGHDGSHLVHDEPPFFSDILPDFMSTWHQSGLYERHTTDVLGEDTLPALSSTYQNRSRCFNCGSPDHVVSSCPEPRNSALVSLSRQIFDFYKDDRPQIAGERMHLIEEFRQQRLRWLDTFIPGQISGELLRDAISPGDGDWLKNIGNWGYPKGWSSASDPRDEIRRRILDEWSFDDDGQEDLCIFTDAQDIGMTFPLEVRASPPPCPDTIQLRLDSPPGKIRRWAEYPPTEFSWSLLPLYNGFALPPVHGESTVSSTFSQDRHALWALLLSGAPPSPPLSEPPPLPPEPSKPAPPLPPFGPALVPPTDVQIMHDDDDDDDMDLSD